MVWTLTSGAKCNSTITIAGSEDSGTYTVTSSTYVAGTGSGTDPGCSSLNTAGTFTKAGVVLNICTNGTTCSVYQ